MTGGLGKRYARALFELAQEAGTFDTVGQELASAVATFEEPRLRAVVLNPGIDASARQGIVRDVVAALGVSSNVGNFVRLLADRDRLGLLDAVATAYEAMVDEAMGRRRVRMRSAMPLTAAEKTELTELARKLVGGEVLVSTEVDPELIGGVELDIGGTVYDGSVRTQLARMSSEMAGGRS
ncbi:MAG TPA: ATP synthase F1 subunit delta [Candidatus Binatia bacterium]|jgi:F-type H+-transporting ATPase subunit delta|nr:ATP synthase F1 subunit delta [Candidatus Binatia bacterium]